MANFLCVLRLFIYIYRDVLHKTTQFVNGPNTVNLVFLGLFCIFSSLLMKYSHGKYCEHTFTSHLTMKVKFSRRIEEYGIFLYIP